MAHAKNYFQLGLKQALPFIFIVGPFGLVFGTIASNAGLSVIEALSFSVFVMAGSAQLTALQLMLDGSPTFIVVLFGLGSEPADDDLFCLAHPLSWQSTVKTAHFSGL